MSFAEIFFLHTLQMDVVQSVTGASTKAMHYSVPKGSANAQLHDMT